jgi:hypothetical protein
MIGRDLFERCLNQAAPGVVSNFEIDTAIPVLRVVRLQQPHSR